MKDQVKELIKQFLPGFILVPIQSARAARAVNAAFRRDKKRFQDSHSKGVLHLNAESQLEARMTFHAHSIEKGLSHRAIRLGFGEPALTSLSKVMQTYLDKGYDKESEAYQNAVSVLREYFLLHENLEHDISKIRSLFSEKIICDVQASVSGLGGVVQISRADKFYNRQKDFKSLFNDRWSIREYDSSPVQNELIFEAIEISKKTPSVCNRQSARVTIVFDPEIIERTLSIQGGFTGYATPPVLLMVTSDISATVGVHERNQAFIDGGLFSMSLLLSLEYVQLAACPLNAMLRPHQERSIREILEVPENESIIMFISVGNFALETPAPKSFRYNHMIRKFGE